MLCNTFATLIALSYECVASVHYSNSLLLYVWPNKDSCRCYSLISLSISQYVFSCTLFLFQTSSSPLQKCILCLLHITSTRFQNHTLSQKSNDILIEFRSAQLLTRHLTITFWYFLEYATCGKYLVQNDVYETLENNYIYW